jgi:hypothetical protein
VYKGCMRSYKPEANVKGMFIVFSLKSKALTLGRWAGIRTGQLAPVLPGTPHLRRRG